MAQRASSPQANAAIYYVASEFDTARPDVKGRHSASEGFLRGWITHADVERFFCCAASNAQAEIFEKRAKAWGRDLPVSWMPTNSPQRYAEAGCLFLPHPVMGGDAWLRRRVGAEKYSLCGITHTLASHGATSAITDFLSAPFKSWDAVICTSHAAVKTINTIIDDTKEYLQERLGARSFEMPQLPVIPLGVNTQDFQPDMTVRKQWRDRLGIADSDIVVLFFGRLSFHSKAHPLPMYLALETAQARVKQKIHLVQVGQFANQAIENAFRSGAKDFCPSVTCHFVDGGKPNIKSEIWSAADIFCSLSDNIQETFGLTPIEAMAAGLPIVASEWNGYRETIRKDIDGILVPTTMPTPPLASDWAHAHDLGAINYDMFCARTSQVVAVDIAATTDAFVQLVENPLLRKTMGMAGAERAKQTYDWREIIPQYQALWAELAARRRAATAEKPSARYRPANPARPDPFHIFAHYPTQILTPQMILGLREKAPLEKLRQYRQSMLINFISNVVLSDEECAAIFQYLQTHGATPVSDLLTVVEAERRFIAMRSLTWLMKLGLLGPTAAPRGGDEPEIETVISG